MEENKEKNVNNGDEELGLRLPNISNLPGFKQFHDTVFNSIDSVSKGCGKEIGVLADTTESTLNTIKNDIIGEIKKQIPSLPNGDPTKIFDELEELTKDISGNVVDKINHAKSATQLVGIVTLIDEIEKCGCIFDLPSKVMPEQFNDKVPNLNIMLNDFKSDFDNGISSLRKYFTSNSICLRMPKDIQISVLKDRVLKYVDQINELVEAKNSSVNEITAVSGAGIFYIIAGSIIDAVRLVIEKLKDVLTLVGSSFPLSIGIEIGATEGFAFANLQEEIEIEIVSVGTLITETLAWYVDIIIKFLEWILSIFDRAAQVA